jgi:hypothetical protein
MIKDFDVMKRNNFSTSVVTGLDVMESGMGGENGTCHGPQTAVLFVEIGTFVRRFE